MRASLALHAGPLLRIGLLTVIGCAVQPAVAGWQVIDLGDPGENWQSMAYGLNEAGQVVGIGMDPGPMMPFSAFFWEFGTGMVDIGVLGGYGISIAFDVNEAGLVAGEAVSDGFVWNSATGEFIEIEAGRFRP